MEACRQQLLESTVLVPKGLIFTRQTWHAVQTIPTGRPFMFTMFITESSVQRDRQKRESSRSLALLENLFL